MDGKTSEPSSPTNASPASSATMPAPTTPAITVNSNTTKESIAPTNFFVVQTKLESVHSPSSEDEEFVYVPRAETKVRVSKHQILTEITSKLHLAIHDSGVHLEGDLFRAWLIMDVPSNAIYKSTNVQKFYGDVEETSDRAIESVAHAAVQYLQKNRNIAIEDNNYEPLNYTRKELRKT